MEVVIDSVPELGVFLEIETIADDASRDARQTSILSLAARLGMGAPERRSYLTMLLQKDRTDAANAADAASPHSSVEGKS